MDELDLVLERMLSAFAEMQEAQAKLQIDEARCRQSDDYYYPDPYIAIRLSTARAAIREDFKAAVLAIVASNS